MPPPFHWLQKLHGWAEEERMHEGINVWVWMIEWTNERMNGLPFLCASSLIYWTAMSALRGFFSEEALRWARSCRSSFLATFSEEALRWARSCRSSFLATFSLGLPLYWTIYIYKKIKIIIIIIIIVIYRVYMIYTSYMIYITASSLNFPLRYSYLSHISSQL